MDDIASLDKEVHRNMLQIKALGLLSFLRAFLASSECNVMKVYIFREANMNHKNNSYLLIHNFQYIYMCLWQWQAKTTAQLRVASCIFKWFSDVGLDFKMYPCNDMQQRQECSDVEALGITFSRGLSITRFC